MAKDKKEPKRQSDEGGGLLIPILTAALVCVGLFTAAVIGVGTWYASTADQRAIEAQQSESSAPARSIPSPSESPVQTVSAPPEPTDSEPQQTDDAEPEEPVQAEDPLPVTPSPFTTQPASPSQSAEPPVSPSPSEVPSASQPPRPSESQAPASPPAQSNTPQEPAGNGGDRASKFANGMVLATAESDNGGDPVYHTTDCRAAQKIAVESELWYSSEQAAKNAGRRICGYCD